MADQERFDPAVLTKAAEDTFTVRRVFGEAYQRDGVLVVPVARVLGGVGAGAGSGERTGFPRWAGRRARAAADETTAPTGSDALSGHADAHGQAGGGGGGYGARVKPLGVYVVDATGAHWQPVVDVNRIVIGMQVAMTVVLSIGLVARALRRH